jgi:hypothetical protein
MLQRLGLVPLYVFSTVLKGIINARYKGAKKGNDICP